MSKHQTYILVVEDEPGIAELLRFTLDDAGFSCDIVSSASDARLAIADKLPQVVLLDWMLPGISGLELCRRLR
ncbi:MAG: response regulator, partial [Glaciimonas sp.]|nr:response regulator [Glaciimonas sp.]